MKNFSLVVPVFNEKDNLLILIEDIVNSGTYDSIDEIIFVNDCSTDGSHEILQKISAKYKKSVILNEDVNKGQSNAILTGISNAKSENIITIDADGQNPPSEILGMINFYNDFNKPILLAGIRLKRKDKLIKVMSSKIANKVRNIILGDDCPDTGCSLKIFRKKDFIQLPFFNGIHRFLPALFQFNKIEVIYKEVSHKERLYGVSKYGTIDRLIKTLYDLFFVLKIKKPIIKKNDTIY